MMRTTMCLALACALCGCGEDPGAQRAQDEATVVDSVLPMPVMLERFRADLADPGRLRSGAESRESLVAAVIDALEQSDTAAFVDLAIDRAEFAWLVFPTSPTAQPPYELPPGIAWLQTQQRNRTGVTRALRELGGRDLGYRGHACAPEPAVHGENRLWSDCVVTLAPDGATPRQVRLFGAILERDGRFAIVSFSNDF